MLGLSIIEVTFTTMSPRLISSAARLKACSFSLVIPKIPSSSILIFLAIFAHLDVVVHLAYHQLLPIWMSVTLLTVEGEWNSKMPLAIFVLLTIGTLTLLILILLKFFMKQTDGALKQDCGGLTLTLEKRCHFPRRDWELFFLLSSGETRSWLSYDHSRISRREWDYIYLFSCFSWSSEIKWSLLSTRIPVIKNSRWPLSQRLYKLVTDKAKPLSDLGLKKIYKTKSTWIIQQQSAQEIN